MKQNPEFVAQGESGWVCKLLHSLYDLKQSLRAWFRKFNYNFQSFGLKRIEVDHFVFYCVTSSENVYT